MARKKIVCPDCGVGSPYVELEWESGGVKSAGESDREIRYYPACGHSTPTTVRAAPSHANH